MKKTILFSLWVALLSVSSYAQNLKKNFSLGLRTGSYFETYSYARKTVRLDQNRFIRDGFFHQAFMNYEFGKRRNMMVEGNFGYNAYSHEEQGVQFDSNNVDRYYYLFHKNKVLSFQLELRYAFVNFKQLNWKHYAGLTIGVHRYINTDRSFSNYENPSVYTYRFDKYSTWYNFFGLQYFGKINLSQRISTQYCLGYALSSTRFAPEGNYGIVGEPTTHRINVNFGFGYQL